MNRIKIPASTKRSGFSPLSQVRKLSSNAPFSLLGRSVKARRQSMKRGRLTVGSDDDDYEEHPKRQRVQHQQHERQRSLGTTTTTTESEDEDAEAVVDDDDHSASKKGSSSRTAAAPATAKAKAKKRPLVTSEPETEDEYVDPGNGDDEEFAAAPKTVAKGKGKAAPTKAGTSKPTKGKAAATAVPERKKPLVALSVTTPTDNDNTPPSVKEEAPPPPKKRKLPTIKKNKTATPSATAAPTTASTSSTAAAPKPAAPPATKTSSSSSLLEGSILPPLTTNPRKTPGMAGQADFDLRDAGVYKLLFKNTGGNTPRSGLSRREKDEERRRELNKMRDEARAKREVEAKEWFDLQAQSEKVARFEERLKRERNPVLWPNVLAAKWREVSERENQGREEGEMAEGQ